MRLDGEGDCSAIELADFLRALDASYQAAARIQLAAEGTLQQFELARRYLGPPFLVEAWGSFFPLERGAVAEPLVVHRVVLESPGVWEFLGGLNPLEVLRKYLNDRHERKKDKSYRQRAEERRLDIDNALNELEVIRRIEELRREFGPDAVPDELRRRLWVGELREPFERLDEFDDRGLVDGGSAAIAPEANA